MTKQNLTLNPRPVFPITASSNPTKKREIELEFSEKMVAELANIWFELLEQTNGGTLTRQHVDFIKSQVEAAVSARRGAVMVGKPMATVDSASAGHIARQMEMAKARIFRDLELKLQRQEVGLSKKPVQSEVTKIAERSVASPNSVFVIHGRDERLRQGMFDFLRALNLNPIEWSQAIELTGKAAPYVGEVLEAAFSHAQAVVVVFSPDDMARLRPDLCGPTEPSHETKPTFQARPNVLFEFGMAMACHPDRTVLVEIGALRPFSDIGGRHIIRMDNSTKTSRAGPTIETRRMCSEHGWHGLADYR